MDFVKGILIPILLMLGTTTTILANEASQICVNLNKTSLPSENDVQEDIFKLTKECSLIEDNNSVNRNQKVYKLQFHGDSIRFNDIPDNWDYSCGGEIGFVELFALREIIVDKDFDNKGKVLQFVVIAPELSVVGDRKINLDGTAGGKHVPQARTGSPGSRGCKGKTGLPGGPGGIFIGIHEKITNGKRLRISAKGGDGGPGQKGGRGGDTLPAREPTYFDYDALKIDDKGFLCYLAYYTYSHGNSGGDGGKGGEGGNPGRIHSYQLNGTPMDYILELRHGKRGEDGKGGERTMRNSLELEETVFCYGSPTPVEPSPPISDGSEGVTGGSDWNRYPPMGFEGYRTSGLVVNDYKNFIRPYAAKQNGIKVLSKFYEGLNTDESIISKYGTLELLDELMGLERQSPCLSKRVDLLPMYENLGERIREYAKHRLNGELSNDYVNALAYAYTAVASVSNRMRDDSIFVTNVRAYVHTVKSNFEILHKSQMKYYANQLEHDYNGDIESKIEEAQLIIESQLRPEISKLNKLMNDGISKLLVETTDLSKDLEEKRKLEARKMMFSVLKTVFVGVALLVPGGQIAAGIALASTAIDNAEPFFTEGSAHLDDLELPEGTKDQSSKFIGALKMRQQRGPSVNVERVERESQDIINGMAKAIVDEDSEKLQENIDSEERAVDLKEEYTFKSVHREEPPMALYKKKNNHKNKNINKKKGKKPNKKQKKDKKEAIKDIDEIEEHYKNMNSVDKDLMKLKKYQEKIDEELIPVFENIFRDLPSDNMLKGQTVAALDVSKWKVQSTLKNVKLYVQQFTKGFNIADEMNQLVESLQDTMDILINMYDHIQNYQQETKLATYIKKLTSTNLIDYHSEDEALEKSLLETRIMIQTNLALSQYNRVFGAFKQFVFPFAHKYLSDLVTPAEFELSQSEARDPTGNQLISRMSENIVKIGLKIDDIQSNIQKDFKFHESLVHGNHHGREVYLWKNESYNEMISKLLSGEEIILSPDVRNFSHYALKANKIRIRFIAKNKSYQGAVDEKLESLRTSMTHMGISYYACGEEIYSMSHSSFTLEVKFDQTYDGKSESAVKLASGVDLVSPFALWRVKILGFDGEIERDLLSSLKNKVDLVLEAPAATYIFNYSDGICNDDTDLSKYYETV